MNFQSQQMNTWQFMYSQLLNEYSSLAYRYHQQTETNNSLYQHLQTSLQERISLLQGAFSSIIPTSISLSNSPIKEQSVLPSYEEKKTKTVKKRVKRNPNSIKRNGKVYTCFHPNCFHFYHSSMGMRQHVRSSHNSGLKKEKEVFANQLISSQEKGESLPRITLKIPSEFVELRSPNIEEFKNKFSYNKKKQHVNFDSIHQNL